MGDRMVIGFKAKQDSPTMYFYSQWGGQDRYKQLANSLLTSSSRWDDDSYATRIAVSQLVGANWSQPLGYGLSVNEFCWPDYDDIPVVTWATQKIDIYVGVMKHEEIETSTPCHSMSFDEYLDLEDYEQDEILGLVLS
jgi:hypothetical protein